MLHRGAHGDDLPLSTGELICALMGRLDAHKQLFSLLALMVEESGRLSVRDQFLMVGTLFDAANIVGDRLVERVRADVEKAAGVDGDAA